MCANVGCSKATTNKALSMGWDDLSACSILTLGLYRFGAEEMREADRSAFSSVLPEVRAGKQVSHLQLTHRVLQGSQCVLASTEW